MPVPSILVIITAIFLLSCNTSGKRKSPASAALKNNTVLPGSSKNKNPLEEALKKIPKDTQPVFGYRFTITGDFNGDGKKEKLVEHFTSGADHKETNKFYTGLNEYGDLVALTIKKNPDSFILSDNKNIDTLQVSSGGQLLGLSYLKNEGDLNGDGTDEVSYVVNRADWSNVNTWYVMTFKKRKWKELYSFPIWDWQLPDLPGTVNEYGLMGLQDKVIDQDNDTLNDQMEKDLHDFKGLVKKIKTNYVQVIFRNDDAEEDTAIVDLRKLPAAK